MAKLLMPKATAVWLVDNTSLTFDQIARFCDLHALEVRGIADGDVAHGIKGLDPVAAGQLTREEIERCQNDESADLTLMEPKHDIPEAKRKGPRYTPVSKRQDRPDAINWLLRNHPELADAQISRLVGTTKPTIETIRNRTHWNMSNIKPVDPVQLGLCSQADLDEAVGKAARRKEREEARQLREARKRMAEDAAEAGDEELVADAAAAEAPAETPSDAGEPATETPVEDAEDTGSDNEPSADDVFGSAPAAPATEEEPKDPFS